MHSSSSAVPTQYSKLQPPAPHGCTYLACTLTFHNKANACTLTYCPCTLTCKRTWHAATTGPKTLVPLSQLMHTYRIQCKNQAAFTLIWHAHLPCTKQNILYASAAFPHCEHRPSRPSRSPHYALTLNTGSLAPGPGHFWSRTHMVSSASPRTSAFVHPMTCT